MLISRLALQTIAQLCLPSNGDYSRNISAHCKIRMIKCVKATTRVNVEVSIQDCILAGRSSYHKDDKESPSQK